MKKQLYLIDIFKFFFCLCVIAIHTSLLKNCPDEILFWTNQCILRLAVPFFFIVSGFMLGSKIVPIENNISLVWVTVKKYCTRQLKLLIAFEIIILLLNAISDLSSGGSLVHVLLKSAREIIFYPRGALWFLQACIIGSLICYLFLRLGAKKLIFPVSILLYAFALICNSYNFIADDFPLLQKIIDLYIYVCLSARNGIFVGFLYISLGIYCFKFKKMNCRFAKRNASGYLSILFFLLYLIELWALKSNGAYPGKDDFSLFISLPIFISFFVCFLSYFEAEKKNIIVKCRNLSVGMYLLHAPISLIVYRLFGPFACKPLYFGIVSLACLIICVIAYKRNGIVASYLK